MMGDAMVDERGSEGTAGVIPALKPILVAADQDVDALIRTARANIARLSLELRVALKDATVAEGEGGDIDGANIGSDLIAAREFLRSALEPRIEERRRELAAQVEKERAEAARRIEAAQIEAAALVDSARAELLAVLLKGTQSEPVAPAPVAPAAPISPVVPAAPANLRIVANRVFPADHPAGSNGNRSVAAANGNGLIVTEPAVESPAVGDHEPAAQAEDTAADPEPQTLEPQTLEPQTLEPQTLEPAIAEALAAASQTDEPQMFMQELAAGGWTQGRAYWTKFLYLDVALPLIAVLVVTIVLLAWLG